jgi:hypothetical protein
MLNRNIFIYFIICVLYAPSLSSQVLRGLVTDAKGQPVSDASVYIREISLGLVADDKGNFRTQIEKGDYTLEISSMGYEKKIITVNIPSKGLDLKVELEDKVYELQEVTVTKGNEDPAYRIMRNVIARTPYFYRQLKSYESDIYLKGSFKIEKIPKLLTVGVNEKELSLVVGKLFILESQNRVKYTAPNKYEQHVVAIKSSIPAESNIEDYDLLGMVTNNIYAPGAFGGLLSPSSFSVYKFSLEDSYRENGHIIYKIKIIPKKKNGMLVNGYLNIVDDVWNVQRAYIIQNELPGMTASYNLTYNEVKPDAFLPTSYDMSLNVSLMGMKGFGKFYSSIQYREVEVSAIFSPSKEEEYSPDTKTIRKDFTKQQKNLKELEALAEKEKLTTREARQMAKLITQTTETEEERKQKRSLEITPLDSFISVTKDTLALLRDSAFWEITRKVPLDLEELQSYIVRDSLKLVADSIEKADSTNNRKAGTWLGAVLWGKEKKLNKKLSIDFAGIPKICPEYNFVDGFWLGQKLTLTYNYKNDDHITITPSAYYTTARKTVVRQIDASATYAPLRNGSLTLSAGTSTRDYAGKHGTNRLINSIASLVFAENTAKFYESRFVQVSNDIDLANGLRLNTQIDYEKRNEPYNNTSFNFLKRTPASNLPHGYGAMPEHQSFSTLVSLQYTPRYYYYIRKGRKYYSHSAYPTFLLSYKKAFPGGKEVNSSYDKVEFSVYQNVKTDIFSRLIYNFNAGMFLSNRQTRLPDYRHFNTNELFITGKFLYDSFALPDHYVYATNDKWFQAHVSYHSSYLLIKQIPFLQNYLLTEDFHLKTLFLPGVNHSEIGYSIGLGSIVRMGVFVGFDDWRYKNTGIVVSLPIVNIF